MTLLRFTLIALLTLIFVGCSSETPAPFTPTVDVPTIAVPTLNIEATVQARVAQELAAQPTDTPTATSMPTEELPTPTTLPTATPVPDPTATPVPEPTLTPHPKTELETTKSCINNQVTIQGSVPGWRNGTDIFGIIDDVVIASTIIKNGSYQLTVDTCTEDDTNLENKYMAFKIADTVAEQEVILMSGAGIRRDLTIPQPTQLPTETPTAIPTFLAPQVPTATLSPTPTYTPSPTVTPTPTPDPTSIVEIDWFIDEYFWGLITIKGTVYNGSNAELELADISFNLYNSQGHFLGTAVDFISTIPLGTTWAFTAVGIGDDIDLDSVEFAEFTAY